MRYILLKEIREYLLNPRSIITAVVSAALILLALFNGYNHYELVVKDAESSNTLAREDASSAENYDDLAQEGIRVARVPDRLMIFDLGISSAVGGKSVVKVANRPRSEGSRYNADPVLAAFGELDLTFIVSIILSLFALLYSYNLISGERELGTLRMVVANSVKRSSIITGKVLGAYFSLAMTFLIPLIAGLTILMIFADFSFSAGEWLRIGLMLLMTLLYLFVFVVIGAAISALTRRSSISFLLALTVWVFSVAIIPRLAVHAAELLSPSFSTDEINSEVLAFRRGRFFKIGRYYKEYFDANPTKYINLQGAMGKAMRYVSTKINQVQMEFEDKLYGEIQAKRKYMFATSKNLSLISPTCAYAFAMHTLADTGPEMLEHFEQDLLQYRLLFKNYIASVENPVSINLQQLTDRLGFRFSVGKGGNIQITPIAKQEPPKLDLGALPGFESSPADRDQVLSGILSNFAAITFFALLFFATAFVAFLRYDVR